MHYRLRFIIDGEFDVVAENTREANEKGRKRLDKVLTDMVSDGLYHTLNLQMGGSVMERFISTTNHGNPCMSKHADGKWVRHDDVAEDISDLVKMLKELEFVEFDRDCSIDEKCVICDRYFYQGHDKECRLNKLIKKWEVV